MTFNIETLPHSEKAYIEERAASFLSAGVFNSLEGIGLNSLNELASQEYSISFDGTTKYIACRNENGLVGFASLIEYELEGNTVSRIANMAIDPETQGLGAGSEIYAEAIQNADFLVGETINPIAVLSRIKAMHRVMEDTGAHYVTFWGNTLVSSRELTAQEQEELMEQAKAIRRNLYNIYREEREQFDTDGPKIDENLLVEKGYLPTPSGYAVNASNVNLSDIRADISHEAENLVTISQEKGIEFYGVLLTLKI
jgi:N-acetylglutamate synthase-like GNAT family acetyltransferase